MNFKYLLPIVMLFLNRMDQRTKPIYILCFSFYDPSFFDLNLLLTYMHYFLILTVDFIVH